jgi:hypothetical protein
MTTFYFAHRARILLLKSNDIMKKNFERTFFACLSRFSLISKSVSLFDIKRTVSIENNFSSYNILLNNEQFFAAQLSIVVESISKHFQPVSKELPEAFMDKSPIYLLTHPLSLPYHSMYLGRLLLLSVQSSRRLSWEACRERACA